MRIDICRWCLFTLTCCSVSRRPCAKFARSALDKYLFRSKVVSNWKICVRENTVRVFFFLCIISCDSWLWLPWWWWYGWIPPLECEYLWCWWLVSLSSEPDPISSSSTSLLVRPEQSLLPPSSSVLIKRTCLLAVGDDECSSDDNEPLCLRLLLFPSMSKRWIPESLLLLLLLLFPFSLDDRWLPKQEEEMSPQIWFFHTCKTYQSVLNDDDV